MQITNLIRPYSVALIILLVAIAIVSCAPAPVSAPSATSAPVIQTVIVQGTPQVITATPGPQATSAVTPTATVPPPPTIKNPDTLVEAVAGEPQSLDPAWDYETAGGEILQNVYQPLVFYNRDAIDKFVGVLATDWKTSTDGKTWTFTIRKNVKFANGDPMNPSDVAYSYVRGFIQGYTNSAQWIMMQPFFGPGVTSGFLDPSVKPGTEGGDDVVNTLYNGDFVAACQAAQKMIVADDTAGTVTMTLKQPWGPFLASIANAWGSVIDKKWAVGQGDWDGTCATAQKFNNPQDANLSKIWDKTNGTGPYSVTRWDHGNQINLDANPNYWQTQPLWNGGPSGAPKIPHVIVKNVPEWGTRFSMMTTGDADLIYVPRNFIAQIDPLVQDQCDANGANCKTLNQKGFLRLSKDLPSVEMDAVFMNQNVNVVGGNSFLGSGKFDGNGVPPNFFSDIHIRKAFVACFDYATFIKQVYNGEAVHPNGPVIPGELGYDKSGPEQQFNLDTCKSEFDAAAKDPGFDKLSQGFFIDFVYNTGNTTRQTAGQILAAAVAKVNPKYHISVVDEPWPVFLSDQQHGRLGMFFLGWLEDYHDPNDWVAPFLSSGGTYASTQSFDATLKKQMDDMIFQALGTADNTKRAGIYTQLNKLAVDNALDVFAVVPTVRHYEQLWVKGWYYNPIYSGAPTAGYYYAYSKGQ